MAQIPVWSGSISFGLVNVPVKMLSAVSPKEVHFHLLHDADGGRIREKRVCEKDGKEVDYSHTVKGYELTKDRYVMLSREELAAADPEADKAIDIEEFVDPAEIDPIYFQSTYYLVPDRGAAKAYALLVQAMEKTRRVGIARVVLRTRQYLCALRPAGHGITLSTMLYADEVNPVPKAAERAAPSKERELRMAESLIESLSGAFRPEKYKDEHRKKVLELIDRKAEGHEVSAPEPAEKAPKAVSLMKALEESLAAPRRKVPAHPARALTRRGRAPRRHPARRARRA